MSVNETFSGGAPPVGLAENEATGATSGTGPMTAATGAAESAMQQRSRAERGQMYLIGTTVR